MTNGLDYAYERCRRIAKAEAKNFYYAFRTLPRARRRAIYAVYAFCRYCDDVADDDLPREEKRRLFEQIRHRLSDSSRAYEDPVFMALEGSISDFAIPRIYFEDVVRGVETDLDASSFDTFDDLRDYCYLVASVVGLICIEIFGYDDPSAVEYAVDLGIAMQLTNILRDVREDAERGRIYIPLEDIRRFGYSTTELMDGRNNESFRALMDFQAARARRYFDSGARLMPLLRRESRACAATLHQTYSRILNRIEESGYDVFGRRIGLSAGEKLLLAAKLWATSMTPGLVIRRNR